MANSNKTYPYPVLGNNDDVEGLFEYTVSPEIDQDEVVIVVDFSLRHPTLKQLLEDGATVFCVNVSCKKTLYKQSSQSSDGKFTIKVKAYHLRDRVDLVGYIVAAKDIDAYDPGGVHMDIDFGPLDIENGDILADGGKSWFIVDKYFDPLKSPVSSFIKIIVSGNDDGAYSVDFDGGVIKIRVPKAQYEDFGYANKHKDGALVHAPIVLPVLIEAIMRLNFESDDFEQSWAVKLRMMIESKNLDIELPFVTAQELLGLPIKRDMSAIKTLISRGDDNNE